MAITHRMDGGHREAHLRSERGDNKLPPVVFFTASTTRSSSQALMEVRSMVDVIDFAMASLPITDVSGILW
jgi:hypothetical protein